MVRASSTKCNVDVNHIGEMHRRYMRVYMCVCVFRVEKVDERLCRRCRSLRH